MYDLNLSVPNITATKYSTDNRFLLLKNYLYELNETLSLALEDKKPGEIEMIKETIEKEKSKETQNIIHLKNESKKRFAELKEQILKTAEEIEMDYSTAISESEQAILQTAQGQFATRTELGEYKNQVDTQFLQTAESVSVVANNNEAVSAELENYKKSANAQFTLQAEEILSQVDDIYLAKTEAGDMEERVCSQISQTAQGITETFSESLSLMGEDLSTVGGEVRELASSLDVYIRRGQLDDGVYGVEIGRSDSNIKARFTNERLSFFQGITEVAYISGSNLYITRAEILDFFKIGNNIDGYFTLDVSENGLEVIWSNGN